MPDKDGKSFPKNVAKFLADGTVVQPLVESCVMAVLFRWHDGEIARDSPRVNIVNRNKKDTE